MSTKDLSPALPAKFTAVFPARRCAGNPDNGTPRNYSKDVLLSGLTFTDTNITPVPLGTSGTTWTFRDTALALYSTPGGPPSNQAAIDALAKQLAQDAIDFLSQSFDIVYNGVAAVPPNALVDILELDYGPDDLTTRIRSAPFNGAPVEYQHWDSSISGCQADDRSPGLLVDIPGAGSGSSMQGVLSLEDGRLVMTYDNLASIGCGCNAVTSCAQICILVAGCTDPVVGSTVTVVRNPVATIAVVGGGNYAGTPTVVVATTNGNGCTATAVMVGGAVDHVVVNTGGSYSAAPLISFSGGSPTVAATATSTLGAPVTIGSCTTVNQIRTFTLNSGGLGFTNGTGYPLAFSGGGGSGAAGTFNVVGGSVSNPVLTSRGSGYTSPPVPDYSAGGAGGHGTSTTVTIANQCCVGVPSVGRYAVTVSQANYATQTVQVNATACTGTSVFLPTITLVWDFAEVLVTVTSCGAVSAVSGVTVTATPGVLSGVTDVTGHCTIRVPHNTAFTLDGAHSYPGFADATASGSAITACSTVNGMHMGTASGYVCYRDGNAGGCGFPIPLTLTLSDSVYGNCTLTYNPAYTDINGTGAWQGSLTVAYPGCAGIGGCPGATVTLAYSLTGDPIARRTLSVTATTSTGGCPGGITAGGPGVGFSDGLATCPPTYLATFTAPANTNVIYCTSAVTITVTP